MIFFFIYKQQFFYADWLYIDKKPILVDGSLGLCMTLWKPSTDLSQEQYVNPNVS